MPGPAPKRSEQRHGHRRKSEFGEIDSSTPIRPEGVLGPDCPEHLDGLARRWYESLRTSGQAVFYTDSDWATAAVTAEAIARFEKGGSANLLAGITTLFAQLACTEGDRRRLRLELAKDTPENPEHDETVASIAKRRNRMTG